MITVENLAQQYVSLYKFGVSKNYLDIAKTIDRLHRRFFDFARVELKRHGHRDLNAI